MKILAYAFLILLPVATSASTVVIVQTNSAGDNIHLIDAATNKVVKIVKDIEVPHGAAMAPDGSVMYVTNESLHTLDFVDMKTLKVTKRVTLSGRPNNLSISKDGRRVYVAIREVVKGAVDVVDTASGTLARTIPHPEVHNTFVTPDGRFVVAGSIAGKRMTMIDQKTEEPAWSMDFDRGVRPIAFEQNPDGSTKRLFIQLSDYHGFAVIDVATRKEVRRIDMPEIPAAERHTEGLQGSPGHGIGVSPDGTQLWMCSKVNSHVYAYSLPDLKYLGGVHVGSHPDWLTFSPDGTLYVANAGSNSVSVVDTKGMREITRVAVGQVPKRNMTAVLP